MRSDRQGAVGCGQVGGIETLAAGRAMAGKLGAVIARLALPDRLLDLGLGRFRLFDSLLDRI